MTSQSSSDRLNRASNEILEATSFLSGANAPFIEQLYAQYLANPDAVDPSWRAWFAELGQKELSPTQLGRGPEWKRDAKLALATDDIVGALTGQYPRSKTAVSEEALHESAHKSIRAVQMVRAYRVIGHLAADLDPLKLNPKPPTPQLDPAFYGFHAED